MIDMHVTSEKLRESESEKLKSISDNSIQHASIKDLIDPVLHPRSPKSAKPYLIQTSDMISDDIFEKEW